MSVAAWNRCSRGGTPRAGAASLLHLPAPRRLNHSWYERTARINNIEGAWTMDVAPRGWGERDMLYGVSHRHM